METGKLVDLKMTPILNFYFYFASFLLKSHKEYGVAWMGVNFYDYHDFQAKTRCAL